MYYLTKFDGVIESGVLVIPKITPANLCRPIFDINYSTSTCTLESAKWGKEGEKLQKVWISWERKELFGWNK